jgi:hypothetical protein
MALSADELILLRQTAGGIVGSTEKDYLTDPQLQSRYTAANEDFDLTIVYVLRLRVGMTAGFVDKSLELNSESLDQRHQHLVDLLAYWENITGVSGGAGSLLQLGTLDTGLDYEADDVLS